MLVKLWMCRNLGVHPERFHELADGNHEDHGVGDAEPCSEPREACAHWLKYTVQSACDHDIERGHDGRLRMPNPNKPSWPARFVDVRAAFAGARTPFTATRYPKAESTDMARSPTPAVVLALRIEFLLSESLGVSRPRTIRMVVDLPAPLGPRKPVTRPGWTTKETSSTGVVLRYRLGPPGRRRRQTDHRRLL